VQWGSVEVIIAVRTTVPAADLAVAREVTRFLERRAALEHPPATLTVSYAVALGIAGMFASPTLFGQVLDRFSTGGAVDGDELVEAAQFEQGFATAEGYAALRCLILWVQSRMQRQGQQQAWRL
jgi:hypothetical protein